MKNKPIIIVPGDVNTIFYEILFKSLRKKRFKSPIILVTSKKYLMKEMKKYAFQKKIELISNIRNIKDFYNNRIYVINVDFKINSYLSKCFQEAFKVIRLNVTNKFINGPVNKSKFLNKKFLGVTEYISKNFKISKNAMLIFNKKLSVCPVTTHLPLKLVTKKINQKLIIEKIFLIYNFYKYQLNKIPNIAVTGINPHCESILKTNEDIKIVAQAVKYAKKRKIKVKL